VQAYPHSSGHIAGQWKSLFLDFSDVICIKYKRCAHYTGPQSVSIQCARSERFFHLFLPNPYGFFMAMKLIIISGKITDELKDNPQKKIGRAH